jgi:hypothetical protein
MTSQSDTPESERPIEEQGLPTSPLDDDEPGQSFSGDKPDAGGDATYGTKANDLDADDADAARAADEDQRAADRGHESVQDDQTSYGTDPTGRER